jgi:hypothetical protein
MLSIYDYIYGSAQLGAGILAVIAGFIALSLFHVSNAKTELRAWKYLLAALVIFIVVEVIGGLGAFGVQVPQYWIHVLVSLLLGLLMTSLVVQIHVVRGWKE